jgi:hypothetical protein
MITVPRPVTYNDGTNPVLPGDHVEVRFFLRRTSGRITYVPGLSKRHAEMEFGGLTWVGINLERGWVIKEMVDPDSGRLKKGVKFLRRATDAVREIEPGDQITE